MSVHDFGFRIISTDRSELATPLHAMTPTWGCHPSE